MWKTANCFHILNLKVTVLYRLQKVSVTLALCLALSLLIHHFILEVPHPECELLSTCVLHSRSLYTSLLKWQCFVM